MIKMFKPFIPNSVDRELLNVLHSGYITQGKRVDEFEQKLAKVLGNRRVISVNSGTSAIQLALRLAGVSYGDEVITTPMTCIATNVPILAMGANIVWADVHPDTGLIDPLDVERKITDKTKAIISVDWAGVPVDYHILMDMAEAHGIKYISDAAHSLGAMYEGITVGSAENAHYTCFSFQAIKVMTTVDGGALTVENDEDYERGRRLRWFGVPRDNKVQFRGEIDVTEWGYKFHMNDVDATIGIASLPSVKVNVNFQRGNARHYSQHLSSYYGRYLPEDYAVDPAWWLFVVLLPKEDREEFKKYMAKHDIEVSQVHWRNDTHTTFKPFLPTQPLKGLESYSERMIAIPNHSQLTRREINHVIDVMNEFVNG